MLLFKKSNIQNDRPLVKESITYKKKIFVKESDFPVEKNLPIGYLEFSTGIIKKSY